MAPRTKTTKKPDAYEHSDITSPMRPEAGVQPHFTKRKPPKTYRFDSSLDPELSWDTNPAREQGEALIARIQNAQTLEEAKAAADELRRMGQPFLNWTGKAEQQEVTIPSLPLFIHERLSTEAIIYTLKGHRRDNGKQTMSLFGDPQHSLTDQVLGAYEHPDKWVNRMVLGDSLQVMNSLVEYEGMAGKVQMIYMDPPYGVNYGSNFQPFVRKRDVKHNEDAHLSREPEMVKAYRDTWELGLHSYLTYMRERLLIARELLSESGSIFVQMSDENAHHVRELMDEVFGPENFNSMIVFTKAPGGLTASNRISTRTDFLIWYFRDRSRAKYTPLYEKRDDPIADGFTKVELLDGTRRSLTKAERVGTKQLPEGSRLYMPVSLTKPGPGSRYDVEFQGKTYTAGTRWWGMPPESMQQLITKNRVVATKTVLRFVRYLDDFPFRSFSNLWAGFAGAANPIYVVQTNPQVVQRCIQMSTDPGDLVLDTTCGSGTTAYVAEQWGRRWITCDVSRVPLALARQRLLTATYDWYDLMDSQRGPVGGFVYKARLGRKGEPIGGVVHRTSPSTISNNEKPEEVVLKDRPELNKDYVRVTGPFCVEAAIPTPLDLDSDNDGTPDIVQPGTTAAEEFSAYVDRMTRVLTVDPMIHLPGNKTIELENIRPVKGHLLQAEATFKEKQDHRIAILFGPQHGAVTEDLALLAHKEAFTSGCATLLVFGFAFEAHARQYLEHTHQGVNRVESFAVEMTPDLNMGDLLKNMRSSQLFSVAGQPDVRLVKSSKLGESGEQQYRVRVLGLDTIDPTTMQHDELQGNDLPAWFLDTDYNGRVFHVSQAFFPRTKAWDSLKKALKAEYAESVWEHLSSTTSAPFPAGQYGKIAVKVIDDRGNELIAVRSIEDASDAPLAAGTEG